MSLFRERVVVRVSSASGGQLDNSARDRPREAEVQIRLRRRRKWRAGARREQEEESETVARGRGAGRGRIREGRFPRANGSGNRNEARSGEFHWRAGTREGKNDAVQTDAKIAPIAGKKIARPPMDF